MIAFQHTDGTVSNVISPEDLTLYRASPEWQEIGELPADVAPELITVEAGAVVIDLPLARDIIRARRAPLLMACDWTQLPDSPLTEAQRSAWASYRQALRDLPDTADPLDFEWPVPPSA